MYVVEFTLPNDYSEEDDAYIGVYEGPAPFKGIWKHVFAVYAARPGGKFRQLREMTFPGLTRFVEPKSYRRVGEMTEDEINEKYGVKIPAPRGVYPPEYPPYHPPPEPEPEEPEEAPRVQKVGE